MSQAAGRRRLRAVRALAATAVVATQVVTLSAGADPAAVHHVLLLSVDGLHQSDVTQCVADGLCPAIASLAAHGTSYSQVSTSEPSDSSPGLIALTTGGSPKLTGVYYDDSYDRTMFAPAAQTASGTQDCSGTPGTETMYAENIDTLAPSTANGGVGSRTILNEAIDPTQLPDILAGGHCVPVMPNDFLRANSIFSVANQAGRYTAWADKHPASDQAVAGHGTPNAVDDPFMTEINADIVPATLVDTRGRTVTFPLPNPTGDPNGFFITDKVGNTRAYDQIKVDAVLNQIDGRSSDGTRAEPVPAIFGMNFQTVSVGEKLVDPQLSCVRSGNAAGCDPTYLPGGYVPGTLAFTPQLAGALASVDAQVGSLVDELKARHELRSTEIILTAKHGQSPIDPSQLHKIGHAEAKVVTDAGVAIAQNTDDDISLLWLADQAQTGAAVAALQADQAGANTARTQSILSGSALAEAFNSPLVDPRTPDLIVQPIPGTIYSTSKAKVAEHGGFAPDDTHVALIVFDGSHPLHAPPHKGGAVVSDPVTTAQVAPTVLAALGLDPGQLDAVRVEHVTGLPGLSG